VEGCHWGRGGGHVKIKGGVGSDDPVKANAVKCQEI